MTTASRSVQFEQIDASAVNSAGEPVNGAEKRLIDHWFPCAAVDESVGTPAGSGLSEKALFTWFASRPIAQARAAVLTTLLPDDDTLRGYVNHAISGQLGALNRLAEMIAGQYPDGPPVVLDVFSGRGIIPLEAARVGATAAGVDLSPVAVLGSRLLADYTSETGLTSPRCRSRTGRLPARLRPVPGTPVNCVCTAT
jgi:putative DNA methylase